MKKKQATRPEDTLPIDPYKQVPGGDTLQDELDALDYEQPSFSCPALDAVLATVEAETDRMMSLYRLGE